LLERPGAKLPQTCPGHSSIQFVDLRACSTVAVGGGVDQVASHAHERAVFAGQIQRYRRDFELSLPARIGGNGLLFVCLRAGEPVNMLARIAVVTKALETWTNRSNCMSMYGSAPPVFPDPKRNPRFANREPGVPF